MRSFYNYCSHCVHIPPQWPRPPYLPQPLCSMDVRSRRVLYIERDHYIWNSTGTSETTGTLSYNFLSSSIFWNSPSCDFFWVFCAWRHLLLLFSLYSPPPTTPPLVFLYLPHQSLCLECFHTPFSMLALGIPTVENSCLFHLSVETVC